MDVALLLPGRSADRNFCTEIFPGVMVHKVNNNPPADGAAGQQY
jgi:hypothetical protein